MSPNTQKPDPAKKMLPRGGSEKNEHLFRFIEGDPWSSAYLAWLLEQGADINGLNKNGRTPLFEYFAQRKGNTEHVLELLSLGADPALRPKNEFDIFYCLSNYGHGEFFFEVCREAIVRGADPSKPSGPAPGSDTLDTSLGMAPLAILATNRKLTPELVDLLVDNGADPNHVDNDGETALSRTFWDGGATKLYRWEVGDKIERARFRKMKGVAKALLSRGASLNFKDRHGRPFLERLSDFTSSPKALLGIVAVILVAAPDSYPDLKEFFGRLVPELAKQKIMLDEETGELVNAGFSLSRSLLTVITAGFAYPHAKNQMLAEARNISLSGGFNAFLQRLGDMDREDLRAMVPLFINVMEYTTALAEPVTMEDRAEEVLIPLLSAAMDENPGAVVRFISRKLKGQMEAWGGVDGMEELTTKLGDFLRREETEMKNQETIDPDRLHAGDVSF